MAAVTAVLLCLTTAAAVVGESEDVSAATYSYSGESVPSTLTLAVGDSLTIHPYINTSSSNYSYYSGINKNCTPPPGMSGTYDGGGYTDTTSGYRARLYVTLTGTVTTPGTYTMLKEHVKVYTGVINPGKVVVTTTDILITVLPIEYTITFDSAGGYPASQQQTLANGSVPTPPEDPTYAGYHFTGWYTDAEATTPYTFIAHSADLTVYAGWTPALAFTSNPEVDATITPGSGLGSYVFSAGSTPGATVSWDWGDGSESSGRYAAHTYEPGVYQWTVTVTNSAGSVMYSDEVSVEAPPADQGWVAWVAVGLASLAAVALLVTGRYIAGGLVGLVALVSVYAAYIGVI